MLSHPSDSSTIPNAFCVDLEEWFHIYDPRSPFEDVGSWDAARPMVVVDTDRLLRLLDACDVRGTFLIVGWVAKRYPDLVRRIVDQGHEVGCHSHLHRLVHTMSPDQFESDLCTALEILRDLSGQPVDIYRAPGFSITERCLPWAFDRLVRHGVRIDVSIVPGTCMYGGICTSPRDIHRVPVDGNCLIAFPVSVLQILGRSLQFSGGGYLRLFPKSLLRRGFDQNHRAGRPVMTYIHPRDINPNQPRLPLSPIGRVRYYTGLKSCYEKLNWMLHQYRFMTVSEVVRWQTEQSSMTNDSTDDGAVTDDDRFGGQHDGGEEMKVDGDPLESNIADGSRQRRVTPPGP